VTPTIIEIVAAPLRRPEVLGRPQAATASWDPWGLMHPLSNDRAFAGQAGRFGKCCNHGLAHRLPQRLQAADYRRLGPAQSTKHPLRLERIGFADVVAGTFHDAQNLIAHVTPADPAEGAGQPAGNHRTAAIQQPPEQVGRITDTREDDLRLDRVDADTKGDLFEHVLRQIRQAGELGQFRTSRHVIRAVVQLVDPHIGDTIHDPAAGTAGFLVGAWDHIRLVNSSAAGLEEIEVDGKPIRRGIGDLLSRDAVRRLHEATFYGIDVDPQMVRLATMNLTLRGLNKVRIVRRNALTRSLDRSAKLGLGVPLNGFDVILANPPFAGRLDKDRIVDEVQVGRSAQTELLFLQYMLHHLKEGGRCGVVVPEGVLFGSTAAHKELRRRLVENNTVEAVLSLPGGAFNPYSGVKTSVLLFRKGGATERVMFLHADNDGFKLDANHDTPIEDDDIPGLLSAFRGREGCWQLWIGRDADANWSEKWWFAGADEIRDADFNLSSSRHRPLNRVKTEYREPLEILAELRTVETEILRGIDELVEAVRGVE